MGDKEVTEISVSPQETTNQEGGSLATNANPKFLLETNASEAHRADSRLPQLRRGGLVRRSNPGGVLGTGTVSWPRAHRIQGERNSNQTPSGGRQPPAGFRPLATPVSPRCGEKGPECGSGKGWRQLHQTNLKSRSRPWLWSVKRMKASMAPSSRPSVALGSVVSPKGAAPSSRGSVSLRTPEGLGLPVPWGRRIFPRTTSQASGPGRKLWLLRRRQTAVPGE